MSKTRSASKYGRTKKVDRAWTVTFSRSELLGTLAHSKHRHEHGLRQLGEKLSKVTEEPRVDSRGFLTGCAFDVQGGQ